MKVYFQDQLAGNHCFGCGPNNKSGLQIKSYWSGDAESSCEFTPAPDHCAAPTKFLNGGIISTVMDCHCVCTAIAYAYKKEGREIGQGEDIWYATAELQVNFLRPVFIDKPVMLQAKIRDTEMSRLELQCQALSNNKICAEGRVVAVRVPQQWMAA